MRNGNYNCWPDWMAKMELGSEHVGEPPAEPKGGVADTFAVKEYIPCFFYRNLSFFYRNNDFFYRNIEFFYKNIVFFYRNIESFYKNIEFFYRNIEFFYRNIESFYKNIGFFYKNIAFFYRKNDFFYSFCSIFTSFSLGLPCRVSRASSKAADRSRLGGVTNLIYAEGQ